MKFNTPAFLKPFEIIPQIWSLFGIYLLIGVVVAQSGILFSLLLCVKHSEANFTDLLISNLTAGNFYTFSISLIASAIVPFLIEYLSASDIKFKHFKILTSLVMVVALLFPMTFFYSDIVSHTVPQPCCGVVNKIDWLQLTFYIASIFFCTYAFCITYLHLDYDSYAELDNANLIRLKKSVDAAPNKDSRKNNL